MGVYLFKHWHFNVGWYKSSQNRKIIEPKHTLHDLNARPNDFCQIFFLFFFDFIFYFFMTSTSYMYVKAPGYNFMCQYKFCENLINSIKISVDHMVLELLINILLCSCQEPLNLNKMLITFMNNAYINYFSI